MSNMLSKMNSGGKQEEVASSGGQVEPPGMHMIYLPYSDDIRYPEEVKTGTVFILYHHCKLIVLP